jgi:hypothetical protein
MSSFAGSIAGLFVCGMVGGYAGLCVLAPTPESKTVVARVADPPAVPCSMQSWPNADRKCLDWTAPRADGDQAKRSNTQSTTVGLSLDPALRRAAKAPESDDVAAAQTTADPAPVVTAPAKARTATRAKTRTLGAVPSNAYAFDGSARRYRQSQGSFFGFGGGGGGFFR